MTKKITSIVLAAGKGSRMKSDLPKPLHCIAGKPIISHIIDKLTDCGIDEVIVVVNKQNDLLKSYVAKNYPQIQTVTQREQKGTGDAVKSVFDKKDLSNSDGVIVVFGDTPLLKKTTIENLKEASLNDDLSILAFSTANPKGYVRIILKDNNLHSIVEEADTTEESKNITLCNGGVMAFKNKNLKHLLGLLDNNNSKGEFILSDMVEIVNSNGGTSNYIECNELESFGIDTKKGLAKAEKEFQKELREKFMAEGVTILDPDSVFFQNDTIIENNVEIQNNVYIGRNVHIKEGVTVRSFSYIEDSVIHENATIGPFSRLRNNVSVGQDCKVGNFVEIKNSNLKSDVKASHLSYIGDSSVDENANIGAGTITCNFDGKNKNKTHIGKDSFIGSNSSLVAPVKIGEGAHIGAGSVITKDVEKGSLVLTRAPLKSVSNWAKKFLGNG
ncbi:MAG: bifunctional UDP-N-acetylglucosamine diphosphorylase/glucosamine-1-phosphate N-acetyltransferase GlmU [Pseudomonadota bacterium]|nr:bifunctional UDP-N-acetylglucosamine diphosphorylase/glucosamine-1-phosphate N-acetyltransferase GlmU [Pseudomonadota bacterium]